MIGDGMNLSLHLVVYNSKGDVLLDKQAEQVADESITNDTLWMNIAGLDLDQGVYTATLSSNTLYPALANMDLEFGKRAPVRK